MCENWAFNLCPSFTAFLRRLSSTTEACLRKKLNGLDSDSKDASSINYPYFDTNPAFPGFAGSPISHNDRYFHNKGAEFLRWKFFPKIVKVKGILMESSPITAFPLCFRATIFIWAILAQTIFFIQTCASKTFDGRNWSCEPDALSNRGNVKGKVQNWSAWNIWELINAFQHTCASN